MPVITLHPNDMAQLVASPSAFRPNGVTVVEDPEGAPVVAELTDDLIPFEQQDNSVPGTLAIAATPAPFTGEVLEDVALTSLNLNVAHRTGGLAPFVYDISAGALPAGVTLSSAGVLAGTPTTPGTYNFTVRATDRLAATATRAYALVVVQTLAIAASPAPPDGTINVALVTTDLAADNVTGGKAPLVFSISAGALPAGVTLSSVGVLSGTPTASGTFNYTVQVADDAGQIKTRAYTMIVAP